MFCLFSVTGWLWILVVAVARIVIVSMEYVKRFANQVQEVQPIDPFKYVYISTYALALLVWKMSPPTAGPYSFNVLLFAWAEPFINCRFFVRPLDFDQGRLWQWHSPWGNPQQRVAGKRVRDAVRDAIKNDPEKGWKGGIPKSRREK